MSPKQQHSVTLGRITALWLVLRAASAYPKAGERELLAIAANTSLGGGSLPIEDGLGLGVISGLVKITGGLVNLSSAAVNLVAQTTRLEPTPQVARVLLLPLALNMTPPWVTFAERSLNEKITAIPAGWRESLEFAGLLTEPLTEEAIEWWRKLRGRLRKIEVDLAGKIGAAGERLSLNHEVKRLLKEVDHDLAERVTWTAQEDQGKGYDVDSFFGLLEVDKQKADEAMMIEVKSSTSESKETFRFFLTKNEWETAKRNPKRYVFHLWRGVKIKADEIKGEGPLVFHAVNIGHCVPVDVHRNGEWMKCRIVIDLEEIRPHLLGTSSPADPSRAGKK